MYTIKTVTTQKRIKELKNLSVFAWEGMSLEENNLKEIDRVLRENGFDKEVMQMEVIPGKLMNKYGKLTGDNAYPEDLSILCILEYYNATFKLMVGARWLDDIIDNNARREKMKKHG